MTKNLTHDGFGLIELLVTLAVVTMVISIGVPSFQDFMQKSRAVSRVEDINAALRLARQVAIEHNFQTLVCPKKFQNVNDGNETCGTVTDWDKGFLVKIDDGSAATIMNKTYSQTGVATSIYKFGTPSNTLDEIRFLATGNLNPTTTGPAITITVSDGSCIGTTNINIAGRSVTDPLQGC